MVETINVVGISPSPVTVTGITGSQTITVSGLSSQSFGGTGTAQQIVVSGTVAQQGPQGLQGIQGPAGTTDYTLLTNKPTLATVATSGSYTDLSNKPTIPTATGTNTGDQTLAIAGSNLTISGANGNTVVLPGATSVYSVVAASGGNYTDIQSALNAVASTGGTVYVMPGTYTVSSTLLIKQARTTLIVSDGATIQCDGSSVTPLIKPNTIGMQNIRVTGGKWLQTNVTASGIAFAFGDTPDALISPTRIENFDLALDLTDANNLTFYNQFREIQMFDNNKGILITGNPVNNNVFTGIRIRPKAGGGGYGISLQNGRSNTFIGCDMEPATGTGITGLILGASAHYNTFLGGWIENNDTNVTINSNANRNSFYGMNISSPLTSNIVDPSTTVSTGYFNINDNGVPRNNPAGFTGTLLPNDMNILPGAAIRTRTAAGNAYYLKAWDNTNSNYKTFMTLTANAVPTADLDSAVTIGGVAIPNKTYVDAADTSLQSQITTNTTHIASNTTAIAAKSSKGFAIAMSVAL